MIAIKRLPWGFAGLIALIVLTESFLARNELHYHAAWTWGWTHNGRAARGKAADAQILAFGDSQVHIGLVPEILERTTGETALNLAVIGGQPTSSVFQLRRALDAGAKPKAILVDFFPLLLNRGIEENENRWPNLLSLAEGLELARASHDYSFVGRMMVARYLYSYRDRDGIQKGITGAIHGAPFSQIAEGVAFQRNLVKNKGAFVLPTNHKVELGDIEFWYKVGFPNREWATTYNLDYLKKFLDLAASRSIPVFWLVPPLSPPVQAKFTEKGQDDRFGRLVTTVLAKYPNVTLLDARTSGYPRDVFPDHTHLDPVGSRTFTTDVGTAMNRARSGDPTRWVHLPTFRPLPDQPPIEDLARSRRVIAERYGKTVR